MRPIGPLLSLTLLCAACDSSPPAKAPASAPVKPPPTTGPTVAQPDKPAEPVKPVKPATPADTPPAAASLETLAAGNNALAFDLYARARATAGNLALSPISISSALTMTWAGARGETAEQMQKVLHVAGEPGQAMDVSGKLLASFGTADSKVILRVANRLFGEKTYTFEKSYLDSTDKTFGAGLEAVDFLKDAEKSRETINAWVEKKTEKRITDLIPSGSLDQDTRLVLVNAIYFLADWQHPFDKARTQPDDFIVSSSNKVRAQMMHHEASYNFAEVDGAKLLELPYQGGEMSMLVALPNEADGIAKLEKVLSADKLAEWSKAMKSERVKVSLPKFEVNPSKATKLDDALKKLGMKLAFDRKGADFTGMAKPPSPGEQLVVSHVFHKAFVKVDEKGTEAAAASAVSMSAKGAAPPAAAKELKVDHPFVYLIRDNKTGLVLFMGRVADPTVR